MIAVPFRLAVGAPRRGHEATARRCRAACRDRSSGSAMSLPRGRCAVTGRKAAIRKVF